MGNFVLDLRLNLYLYSAVMVGLNLILHSYDFQVKMYVNDFKDDIIVYSTQK